MNGPPAPVSRFWSTIAVYQNFSYVGAPVRQTVGSGHPFSPDIVPDDTRSRSKRSESAAVLAEVNGASVRIKPLASHDDYERCVALQREVWGAEYDDTVPASLLQVVPGLGGVLLGAFSTDRELLGFVFGLTGVKNEEIVHWSHALGVRETARNFGVGRLLKDHQRAELARRGIRSMYWTFDPLIAKNAHFNLTRLGARVVEYVPDMYGTTRSPLHHGLATDRFVVVCSTAPTAATRERSAPAPSPNIPILADTTPSPEVLFPGAQLPREICVEIPTDFDQVLAASPAAAAVWHSAVRRHFQWALRNSYIVTGLHRDPVTSRSFYTLQQKPADA
jgi:predicted GNAT superfamily acetyltransferase